MKVASLLLSSLAAVALPAHSGSLARLTDAFPELNAPPQGEAQWVARSMRLNGLPMTVKAFHSRLTPDAVMHHYESWGRATGGAQLRRSMSAPWQVLAIQLPHHYITIQARAIRDGSEGTIAVTQPLDRAELATRTGFPRPPTTTIVNLQQYDDFGAESEHISLTSARSVAIEALAFSHLLVVEGWQVVRDQRSSAGTRGHVLEAQKGAQHALLTLMPDHGRPIATAIVIVWRKA
ncbi:MAG: hypothetical protein ACREV5_13315 [Steroidobacter sp.]